MTSEPVVLGIETSCDETGVGIACGSTLLVHELASSIDENRRFRGVVPEISSRAHVEALLPTIHRALASAHMTHADIDAVAVTSGPGLMGCLVTGVAAAKAYAAARGIPIYAVNHLAAHIAIDCVEHGPLPERTMGLLVSGGHSSLIVMHQSPDLPEFETLGRTLDDAVGEAFDKVARALGLPFPGGPHLDLAARDGNPAAIAFPRALTATKDQRDHRFDFSFSGLKTAVMRWIDAQKAAGVNVHIPDVAASFQEAVADVLTRKALDACRLHGVDTLVVGGGVAANSRLRSLVQHRAASASITVRIPSPGLCTDNGAMVAVRGAQLIAAGACPSELDFPAQSTWEL